MSVDVTDGTTTLNAYKLATKVGVGDVIVIYGKMGSYNSTKQIAEGAIAEIKTAHVCSEYTDATCKALAACVVCGATTGEYAAHVYGTDGSCTGCGYNPNSAQPVWTLVTDVTTLKAGDQIVIVSKDNDYAMSTNQKTSNRGSVAITKTAETLIINDDVQILTLANGTKDGTFAFYTGSGYLYAASGSSNHLKTSTTLDDNGSWKITMTDGTVSVVAQGTNARNVMQYNTNSSNNGTPLFACYDSAKMEAIAIYVLVTPAA